MRTILHVLAVTLSLALGGSAFAETPATIDQGSPLPVTLTPSAAAVDGSSFVGTSPGTLFGGATPVHGFQIYLFNGGSCSLFFSDVGTAQNSAGGSSMGLGVTANGTAYYTTPPGYRPAGPVSVVSSAGCTAYFAARSW